MSYTPWPLDNQIWTLHSQLVCYSIHHQDLDNLILIVNASHHLYSLSGLPNENIQPSHIPLIENPPNLQPKPQKPSGLWSNPHLRDCDQIYDSQTHATINNPNKMQTFLRSTWPALCLQSLAESWLTKCTCCDGVSTPIKKFTKS